MNEDLDLLRQLIYLIKDKECTDFQICSQCPFYYDDNDSDCILTTYLVMLRKQIKLRKEHEQ